MDSLDLGKRVCVRHHEMKLTKAQLAERMGISDSIVGHLEHGTRSISLETFVTLCNVLEAAPTHLLCGNLKTYDDHMAEWLPESNKQN